MSALDVVDDSTLSTEKHSVSLQAILPHTGERSGDVNRLPVCLNNLVPSHLHWQFSSRLLQCTFVLFCFLLKVGFSPHAVWCTAVSGSTVQHTFYSSEASGRTHTHPPAGVTYCMEPEWSSLSCTRMNGCSSCHQWALSLALCLTSFALPPSASESVY